MDSGLSAVYACGCRQLASTNAWVSCPVHGNEHPGGWASWETYRSQWAHVECCVCHGRGIQGFNDFESIWIGTGMMYAHRSCYHLGKIFPDMRPSQAWVHAYAKEHHRYG